MKTNDKQRGVAQLFLATMLFIAASYLTNIWLGRHLGPGLYGIYGVLTSLLTALNIMQVSGVPQAASHFISEDENVAHSVLKSALKVQITITIILSLFLIGLAPFTGLIFRDQRFVSYIILMTLVLPFYGLFALYGGYHNGLHNFKRQALMNAAYSLAKIILVITLVSSFSLYGVIVAFVVAPIFAIIIGFEWPKKDTKAFPILKLLLYSYPLIAYSILSTLQLSIDLFSVKSLTTSPLITGYYAAAQNIALITFFSMGALGQVLFPYISKLHSNNQVEHARVVIGDSLRNLLLLLLPLTALIFATAPALISLLFGNEYAPAVPILRILVTGYIFITIFAMFASVLNGVGRAKTTSLISLAGLFIGLVGSIILIPKVGASGAAIATSVGGIVVATGSMWITFVQFKYRISVKSLLKITIGASIILALGLLTPVPVFLLPLWWIILGLIYTGWLVIFKELNQADWQLARGLMPGWLSVKLPK